MEYEICEVWPSCLRGVGHFIGKLTYDMGRWGFPSKLFQFQNIQ